MNSWLTTPEVYIKGTSSVGPPPLTYTLKGQYSVRWFFGSFNPIYSRLQNNDFEVFVGFGLKLEDVRHVTGTGSGLFGGIPRVVVQISSLTLKGPL